MKKTTDRTLTLYGGYMSVIYEMTNVTSTTLRHKICKLLIYELFTIEGQ